MLVLVIGASVAASAQEKRDTIRTERKEAAHLKLKNELGLSDDQAAKLKVLNQEFKTKHQALKDNTSLSGEERKKQNVELLQERKKKINELLTPEQQEKFAALEKKQVKKFRDRKERRKESGATPQ